MSLADLDVTRFIARTSGTSADTMSTAPAP